MYSFTGRVFPPMRRPLHLILHHLAVHLNVSTGGNLPPQLSDAGCERLYLLRIIGRGSFTLSAIERLTLRCKSVIFSLQIFFVSQQFVKRCDLPFPQKVTLPPVAILRFYDMPENEVREMLYLLNTANLDCYEYYHPDRSVIQSGPVAFCGWLETKDCRPYRTEVQLYKSLLFLKRSIDRDLIVSAQREALQTLRCIISNLEYRFYKAYGMEIEDKRTVYGECTYRLVPREDEPSVCLMHDWIYLPTA